MPAFHAAIESADTEPGIDLLADDVFLMPDHRTILRGGEEASKAIRSASDAVFRLRNREVIRMEVRDDVGCMDGARSIPG